MGAGLGSLPNERGVHALAIANGELFAGGLFLNSGSVPLAAVAKWNGTEWMPLAGSAATAVFALASDGPNLYVGGVFTAIGGIIASNVARWDGTNWSPLGFGLHRWRINDVTGRPFDDGRVFALAARERVVYGGGQFETAGTINATNIAKWDGTNWSSLGGGLSLVRALTTDAACVYAGGDSGIHCWNGASWSAIGGNVNSGGSVNTIVKSGMDLFVGGYFASTGAQPARSIAKWDGTAWCALGSGLENPGELGAAATAMASSGVELFVAGLFTLAGGHPATNIARWHIPHSLKIQRAGNEVALSWPTTGTNFLLETCSDLGTANWQAMPNLFTIVNNQCIVTNTLGPSHQFYRLGRK
jgi:hypothetical protein